MAAILEVKYFNTFVSNKQPENGTNDLIWNGSLGIPGDLGVYGPGFRRNSNINEDKAWIVEEARIRGGYNNTSTDYGVRAYLVEEEPNASIRFNSMIYSGIYNSRTNINQTNVFSIAEEITKSLEPANGSIQKLYAEDTNLIIFQEVKVSKALIDKDAIYSAEGGGLPVSSLKVVIGQVVPFAGNYGIGTHPESFAVYGYNKYFVDPNQSVVLRLSGNGIEEISSTGMTSFFRRQIVRVDSPSFGKGKLIGSWDMYNKEYNLSIQPSSDNTEFKTLSYDERAQGWISFYNFKPSQSFSVKNRHYTTTGSSLYIHDSATVNYGSFYGVDYPSSVKFIFNPNPSNEKVFNTINYEGSNGWEVTKLESDRTGAGTSLNSSSFAFDQANPVLSFVQGAYDSAPTPNTGTSATVQPIFRAGFDRKENKYCANIINNTQANFAAQGTIQGEVIYGDQISGIKGFFGIVTMQTDSVTDVGGFKELFAVSSNYTFSSGY